MRVHFDIHPWDGTFSPGPRRRGSGRYPVAGWASGRSNEGEEIERKKFEDAVRVGGACYAQIPFTCGYSGHGIN